MASWFSGWSPIKSFPAYHGPYDVGTVDVEIPVADLPAPSDTPEDAQATVAFRLFYPCVKPKSNETDRPVRWIPQPQKETVAAFAKFLGARDRIASLVSYFPQQLYWIKLPAHRNAKLLDPPTSSGRWPVTFFSHGLAGSRNAYSQVCGELASSGTIVVAMDHRDGSSPIQYVRATANTDARTVQPVSIPHHPITPEVYAGRDKQLRIRLWEVCLAYEALVKIDGGQTVENLDSNTSKNRSERIEVLRWFDEKLDIHRPGSVSWAGHSFGAATMVQLVKSIYYHAERPQNEGRPLIVPRSDAAIIGQVMPESPLLLLDLWGLSLQSPEQKFLWERPLPSYAVGGPQGSNVLAVLSDAFRKWEGNLKINKQLIAAPSSSRRPSHAAEPTRENGKLLPHWARLRASSPASDSGYGTETSSPPPPLQRDASRRSSEQQSPSNISEPNGHDSREVGNNTLDQRISGPHIFYVEKSQHFNQSDFGVLFPWLAKRFAKAEEPERILELNVRAMVQLLRQSGVHVGGDDDSEILSQESGIRGWTPIPLVASDAPERMLSPSRKRRTSVSPIPSDDMATGQAVSMGRETDAQLEMQVSH